MFGGEVIGRLKIDDLEEYIKLNTFADKEMLNDIRTLEKQAIIDA
jgi:hypothetical protein